MTQQARGFTVLGIETSCDETAAAVVHRNADGRGEILSDIVLSQTNEHAAFGGVVPEIAARAHVEALDGVIRAAMTKAGAAWKKPRCRCCHSRAGTDRRTSRRHHDGRAISGREKYRCCRSIILEGHALTATLTDAVRFPTCFSSSPVGTRSSSLWKT